MTVSLGERLPTLARSAAGVIFLLALAYAVLPVSLGGRTTLVVVQGNSMEPTYHSGDLVYTRTSTNHAVGDVIVYRLPAGEPGAGRLIIHRLVALEPVPGGDGTRFVTQGDNRDTPDMIRPQAGDVVGTPVLNLGPWATRFLLVLPFVSIVVLGASVVWLLWPTAEEPLPA